MSATNFQTPPNIFTVTLNNTTAFKLNPLLGDGIRMATFNWISGTITIRGNVGILNATTTGGTPIEIQDGVITLSSSAPTLTLVGNGNDCLSITIDSSAGVCAMICYG